MGADVARTLVATVTLGQLSTLQIAMKILHLLDHSLPLHSGYSFRTVAILKEQRRLGLETVHLTSPKQGKPKALIESVEGWQFYRTMPDTGMLGRIRGLWPIALMRATYRRLLEVIEQERPAVLHAHSPALNAWPVIWAGKACGIPVVYEVRAFWEDAAVDLGTSNQNGIRYRLTRRLETEALRRVDAIFTICEGLRADIVSRGIANELVTVIPNSVDIERFSPITERDPELEKALGLQGKTVLGFCGSFYAYEGLDLAVRALPRILLSRPETRLVLVGGGFEELALRRLVDSLNLNEHVVFVGRVLNETIGRYYSLMDVLVFPRHSMRLTDLVTPLKPLESMAQGKVVVASDVGGHRELIRDGYTGVLFTANSGEAFADATLRLLGDEHLRARLIRDGRRFVEQDRNWPSTVARYLPVYSRIC